MLWIGMAIGFVLGGNLGVLVMACFKTTKN